MRAWRVLFGLMLTLGLAWAQGPAVEKAAPLQQTAPDPATAALPAAKHPNSWVLWLTAAGEATVADMALSQHCLRTVPGCTEANPLLRGSAVRAWTIDLSLAAGMALWSRRLERHHHRWWLLPLVALTAAHVIGAVLASRMLKRAPRPRHR